MGINTDWIDENGDILGRADDPQGLLSRLALTPAVESTVCLRFLDPYGDTYFNQRQLPVLIEELEALRRSGVKPEIAGHLEAVLQVVRGARGATHTYIRFTGD